VSEKHREKQHAAAAQRKIDQSAKKAAKKEAKLAAEAEAAATEGGEGLEEPVRVTSDCFEDVPQATQLGPAAGGNGASAAAGLDPGVRWQMQMQQQMQQQQVVMQQQQMMQQQQQQQGLPPQQISQQGPVGSMQPNMDGVLDDDVFG